MKRCQEYLHGIAGDKLRANKTPYVGYIQKKGGEGISILVAGAVHRNRIIPAYFRVYSSKTIHEEAISQNQLIMRTIEEIYQLYPSSALLMDRGFASENIVAVSDGVGEWFCSESRQGCS